MVTIFFRFESMFGDNLKSNLSFICKKKTSKIREIQEKQAEKNEKSVKCKENQQNSRKNQRNSRKNQQTNTKIAKKIQKNLNKKKMPIVDFICNYSRLQNVSV